MILSKAAVCLIATINSNIIFIVKEARESWENKNNNVNGWEVGGLSSSNVLKICSAVYIKCALINTDFNEITSYV